MAVNNRNEADIAVDAVLVPTLTLAAHKTLLKESINSSTVFRKDVISSDTPAVGAVTVSFLSKDLSTITTSGDLVVSFSDIENGDVKYLAITKALTDEITFSGATDVSARKDYITSDITYIIYQVINKNGSVIVNTINIDNDVNNGLRSLIVSIGDWNMDGSSTKNVTLPSVVTIDNYRGIRDITIRPDVGAILLTQSLMKVQIGTGVGNGSCIGINDIGGGILEAQLYRFSGYFDNLDFSATSYNRGWILLDYIDL